MKPKGLGTVVQIKGKYRARWRTNGKDVYGPPRDLYEEADRDRVNNKPQPKHLETRKGIPTLEEWAHQMNAGAYGQSIEPTTLGTVETIRLKYIEGQKIGRMKLHKISRLDMQELANGIAAKLSASYTRRIIAYISKLFSMAIDEGYLVGNPAQRLKLPTVFERENTVLSPSQAVTLLNPKTRIEAIMLLALHTGMRRSEICRLRWTDVKDDSLMVPGKKSARSKRYVPLTADAKAAIDAQPRRSEYVFTTETGRPLNERNVTRDFTAKKADLGIPAETRLHDLRGSFISMLISQGADPRTVMELAGHSDLRTTMKSYARSREDVKKEVVNVLRENIRKYQV